MFGIYANRRNFSTTRSEASLEGAENAEKKSIGSKRWMNLYGGGDMYLAFSSSVLSAPSSEASERVVEKLKGGYCMNMDPSKKNENQGFETLCVYTIVLGLGVSGKSAASLLLHQGKRVIGVDRTLDPSLSSPNLQLYPDHAGTIPVSWKEVEQVVVSPGIPPLHPLILQAKKEGVEVIGEIELSSRFLQNRVIGITGSNGKTTTTLLITHVLRFCGKKARALGNVGDPLSSYLLAPDPEEILALELSSFQLETFSAKILDFALILNISPNHLDRHSSMEEYAQAKLSIQHRLKAGGKFFLSRQVLSQYPCDAICIEECGFSGNVQNMQAAFAICHQFGITEKEFAEACQTFSKPPHRMEKLGQIEGVCYYNDSKSSNVESVMYAVRTLDASLILIVGGTDKGASYMPWTTCFPGKVKQVIAYGAASEKIAKEIGGAIPLKVIKPFEEAVFAAIAEARQGDTVLLSPGCSSYDQFRNFEHRGDVFKDLVQRQYGSKKNNSHCGDG